MYLLNSSKTKIPPFCVKHFRMWSSRTKNCKTDFQNIAIYEMKSIFCNYVVKKNASIATSCLPYKKMCQRVKNAALHKHDLATFLHCCFLCMLKSVLCAFPKRITLHWSYKVHSTDISLYRLAIFFNPQKQYHYTL